MTRMRDPLILSLLSVMLAAPVAAQSWQEYEYPESGFSIAFPAPPVVKSEPYAAGSGKTVSATSYTVRQPTRLYSVTVADFSNMGIDGDTAIAHAVDQVQAQGKVRVDVEARINRQYGRELSIVGNDDSHSAVAIFFVDNKLYLVEGSVLATSADMQSGDAARFQQSLRFPR